MVLFVCLVFVFLLFFGLFVCFAFYLIGNTDALETDRLW